jgi:hypothetical protein
MNTQTQADNEPFDAHNARRGRTIVPIPSNEPNASKAANRKIKKREFDRRAQQAARERTKTRIACLEKIVEAVQGQDEDCRVSALATQVAQLQKQNDELAGTLRQIVVLAGNQRLPRNFSSYENVFSENSKDAAETFQHAQMYPQRSNAKLQTPMYQGLSNDSAQTSHQLLDHVVIPPLPMSYCNTTNFPSTANMVLNTAPSLTDNNMDLCNSVATDSPMSYGAFNDMLSPIGGHVDLATIDGMIPTQASNLDTYDTSVISSTYPGNGLTYDMLLWNADNQTAINEEICECATRNQHMPGKKRKNLWRFANDTLTSTRTPNMQQQVIKERRGPNDSSAIKAILEGWNTVPNLEPSWQALRQIDQQIFATCGDVERLAILHVMHLLLQYHADSTPERFARLPTWYSKR